MTKTRVDRTIKFNGWDSITDVPCPFQCDGKLRWAEAGFVPGYRICDGCGRHFELEGGVLRPNDRRNRITAADRAAARRSAEQHELHMAIYHALVAVRNGLSMYLDTVSWDRHPYYRPEDIDTLADIVGGPNMPHGLASLMDDMRRKAYPAAWDAWEKLRDRVPQPITIHVSPDGETANLIHVWTLGTYRVVDLLVEDSAAMAKAKAKADKNAAMVVGR